MEVQSDYKKKSNSQHPEDSRPKQPSICSSISLTGLESPTGINWKDDFYYSITMVLHAIRCNSLFKFTSEKRMGLFTGINPFGLPLTTCDPSLH